MNSIIAVSFQPLKSEADLLTLSSIIAALNFKIRCAGDPRFPTNRLGLMMDIENLDEGAETNGSQWRRPLKASPRR